MSLQLPRRPHILRVLELFIALVKFASQSDTFHLSYSKGPFDKCNMLHLTLFPPLIPLKVVAIYTIDKSVQRTLFILKYKISFWIVKPLKLLSKVLQNTGFYQEEPSYNFWRKLNQPPSSSYNTKVP